MAWPLKLGLFLSQVIVRMPSGLWATSTTVPPTLTMWFTVYRYGVPKIELFGYQSHGLLIVICWSNIGVAPDGPAPGLTVWVIGVPVATTFPLASTIWLVSVTDCAVVPSLTTLTSQRTTADAACAVVVDEAVSE